MPDNQILKRPEKKWTEEWVIKQVTKIWDFENSRLNIKKVQSKWVRILGVLITIKRKILHIIICKVHGG